MKLDLKTEEEIKKRSFVYLEKCRKNDKEHTIRTVSYGENLTEKEGGDESIAKPSIYFHDTGRSKFENPTGLTPKDLKLHMKYGSEIAEKELGEMKYDSHKIEKISRIISIHDYPDKIKEWGDIDAIITMEADRADRYGKDAIPRWKEYKRSDEFILNCLEEGIDSWFVTNTGRKIAEGLFEEMKKVMKKSF